LGATTAPGYVMRERGITENLGLDGDYRQSNDFLSPTGRFEATNPCRPSAVERTFDLAMALEPAEHLARTAADSFVSSLCAAADNTGI
jgi:hypothetical protein